MTGHPLFRHKPVACIVVSVTATLVAFFLFVLKENVSLKHFAADATSNSEKIKWQQEEGADEANHGVVQPLHVVDNCSDLYSQNTTAAKQDALVRVKAALLLHIGKAGGGTFVDRTRRYWKLPVNQCHPDPCLGKLNSPEIKALVLTIRDPIDRFVSAFVWRTMVICDPQGDERQSYEYAARNITRYCKEGRRGEQKLLFKKYKRNANMLAEALCTSEDTARRDVLNIAHARYSIQDWLGPYWKEEIADHLYPIVLETNFDFTSQIDASMEWVNNITGTVSHTDMATRKSQVQQLQCLEHDVDEVSLDKLHSSSSRHNVALSSLGEKCVARYYKQDYKILKELKQLACKSNTCREAIQSILDRRSRLLNNDNHL